MKTSRGLQQCLIGRSFVSHARGGGKYRANGAEDLVGDGAGQAGVVVGGDAFAEEEGFVAYCRFGDGGDIDYGEVHGDAADDGGSLAVEHGPAAGAGV